MEMIDREKVIKGLEEAEIMLEQAADRGGEMAVMRAFKCYNHVFDALVLLKKQEKQIKNRDESLEKALEEIKWLRGMMKDQETIIRCKDCKKRNQHHECEYGYHSDDWFCADGKRNEGR